MCVDYLKYKINEFLWFMWYLASIIMEQVRMSHAIFENDPFLNLQFREEVNIAW